MCLSAYYNAEDELAKQIKEWAEHKMKNSLIYCPCCGFTININSTECEHCNIALPDDDHKAW